MHHGTRSGLHSVPWSEAQPWLFQGRSCACTEEPGHPELQHPVTGVGKGTGQEDSLAGAHQQSKVPKHGASLH